MIALPTDATGLLPLPLTDRLAAAKGWECPDPVFGNWGARLSCGHSRGLVALECERHWMRRREPAGGDTRGYVTRVLEYLRGAGSSQDGEHTKAIRYTFRLAALVSLSPHQVLLHKIQLVIITIYGHMCYN